MGSEPSFLTRDPQIATLPAGDPAAQRDRFFVRMQVPDRPGVLASVAGGMAAEEVSIERVIQERGPKDSATLVLVTHPTSRGAIEAALASLDAVDEVAAMPILEAHS